MSFWKAASEGGCYADATSEGKKNSSFPRGTRRGWSRTFLPAILSPWTSCLSNMDPPPSTELCLRRDREPRSRKLRDRRDETICKEKKWKKKENEPTLERIEFEEHWRETRERK